ncbi:MAG: molybdopterin-dependent oxidoreductase [Acidobacteriota bacterium]
MVGKTLTELKPVRSEGSSRVGPRMDLDRRTFLQVLGSGLLITVVEAPTQAQPPGDRVSGTILARLYLNEDGTFTALSGKVDEGQGPRTELTEAAAEDLGVALDQVHLIMADTDQVPDDGITAGSRTTPINVPEMRRAAAAARELLQQLAAEQWRVDATMLKVEDGVIQNPSTGQTMSYRDLVRTRDVVPVLSRRIPSDVALRPVEQWKVLGKPTARPNVRDLVTGTHRYPSDIVRPQMLYGAVLRPPSFGAELKSIDLTAVEAMDEVKIVRDGSFVGFAAPSSFLAARAARAAAAAARWQEKPQEVSHRTVHSYLIDHAERERARPDERGSVEDGMAQAQKTLAASYTLAYIQHAPMEPRAAVAEWNGDRLTVWVGCDGPFRARSHLSEELGIPSESIRVIVPDMGGGFGGKHTSEVALEAARIARAVGKPVWMRWTREEEFTWAYFRPAAVIECRGGLGADHSIVAWDFSNINGGGAFRLVRSEEEGLIGVGGRSGLWNGEELLRGGLRRGVHRPTYRKDQSARGLSGVRVRSDPESGQPARSSPGLYQHGSRRRPLRRDRIRKRQDPERNVCPLPGAEVSRSAQDRPATGQQYEYPVRGCGRDSDSGHRACHRQRRLRIDGGSTAFHADQRGGFAQRLSQARRASSTLSTSFTCTQAPGVRANVKPSVDLSSAPTSFETWEYCDAYPDRFTTLGHPTSSSCQLDYRHSGRRDLGRMPARLD